jgi:transposase
MLRVKTMTTEEAETIRRWSQSRTEPARRVERARILARAAEGKRVPAIATELHLDAGTVRHWLKRFNAKGLPGLEDEPRAGRPLTYSAEIVGTVVQAALTDPQELGLPFGSWTLDRLEAYLNEHAGIPIKRSRIDDLLRAEGLRWRTQETWFGKRVDPAFAEKRGASNASTPSHRSRV